MPNYTTTIGDAYIATTRGIPALDDDARVRRVANVTEFLKMTTLPPPFCLWVFSGEEFEGPEAIRDEGAVQQSEQQWDAYLGCASFGADGEGAFTSAAGAATGEDAETLTSLLCDELRGVTLYVDGSEGVSSRAYPTSVTLYDVTEASIIFRCRFRNALVRIS